MKPSIPAAAASSRSSWNVLAVEARRWAPSRASSRAKRADLERRRLEAVQQRASSRPSARSRSAPGSADCEQVHRLAPVRRAPSTATPSMSSKRRGDLGVQVVVLGQAARACPQATGRPVPQGSSASRQSLQVLRPPQRQLAARRRNSGPCAHAGSPPPALPPMRRTRLLLMASPSPVPCALRRFSAACSNDTKMRSRSSARMPAPVVVTRRTAHVAPSLAPAKLRTPRRAAEMASARDR